jgi:glutamine synthetase type III
VLTLVIAAQQWEEASIDMPHPKLIEMYNATSTDDGTGEIEPYQVWLERQLLFRINGIDELKKDIKAQKEIIDAAGDLIIELDKYIASISGKSLKWDTTIVKNVEELSNRFLNKMKVLYPEAFK